MISFDKLKSDYRTMDASHSTPHILTVLRNARYIKSKMDISNKNWRLIRIAIMFHDIGNLINRKTHEITSGQYFYGYTDGSTTLTQDEKEIIVDAINNHRNSSGNPQHIVGKVVHDADNMFDVDDIVKRTLLHNKGNVTEALDHLHEKFGSNGTLKFTLPFTDHVEVERKKIDKLTIHEMETVVRQLSIK